jgi:hypothetical protein
MEPRSSEQRASILGGILRDLPRRRGAPGTSVFVIVTFLFATLPGCSTASTQVTPSPTPEAGSYAEKTEPGPTKIESGSKPLTVGDMVIMALLAPVALAGAAFLAVYAALHSPALVLSRSLPAHEPPPGRTPSEVARVAQEKTIAEERSEQSMALRRTVEKRTVLCPGRTTDQVLSGMWKVAEARGLNPGPARFEGKRALEGTGASVWLRAYAEASDAVGSPILLTVEVGALFPEERKQFLEGVLSMTFRTSNAWCV